MVICKFYRQGNCRYGQYCQFEHVNHFGGPKTDLYNEDEIAVIVAKEVLLAERGGQWMLSCFAPLKERPCIPGMEDLAPDEVRWEMYQAQKNGMVEQAKLHFQQLCQDIKAKRDALKNPNRETITMLKKLLGSSQKASQLNLANSTPANNVFGKQTFGVQNNNSFSGGFSSSNNTSIFGRSNNNTAPMFGGTPTFGNNIGFGTTTNTSSMFSGTTNTPTFGTVASQSNPIFGSASQGIFGQSNVFGGGTNQPTTSAFDNGATSSTSLFNNPMTSQANTALFGAPQTTTANLFGGSSNTQTNSVFGATTSSGPFNAGLFNQPKTLPAFGGAPVFGGATNYTGNSGSIFGGSAQTFGTPAISSSGIFGATATTTPAFGGSAAAAITPAFGASAATTTSVFGVSTSTTTPAFGASVAATTLPFGGTAVTSTPAFGLGQQPVANTFGTAVSTPNVFGAQNTGTAMPVGNNIPFGESVNVPFVTVASSQFGCTSTTSTPFASAGFGLAATNTSDTFGTAATSSNSLFANAGTTFSSSNATVPNASPFSAPIFGAPPFGGINKTMATTMTATATNPFAPRIQQSSTPFSGVTQNQLTTASPFGNIPLTVTITSTIIDDSVYTAEDALTNDEKSMYLAEKFVIGKIPLKPPTKNIK